jgi:hypothetical protein
MCRHARQEYRSRVTAHIGNIKTACVACVQFMACVFVASETSASARPVPTVSGAAASVGRALSCLDTRFASLPLEGYSPEDERGIAASHTQATANHERMRTRSPTQSDGETVAAPPTRARRRTAVSSPSESSSTTSTAQLELSRTSTTPEITPPSSPESGYSTGSSSGSSSEDDHPITEDRAVSRVCTCACHGRASAETQHDRRNPHAATACECVAREKVLLYAAAKEKRFRSPEAYVRFRFLTLKWQKKTADPTTGARVSDRMIEHVESLWQSQGGKCAFTGAPLEWYEDADSGPSSGLVSIARRKRTSDLWDNLCLVCRRAAPILSILALEEAQRLVHSAVEFLRFGRAHASSSVLDICSLWDKSTTPIPCAMPAVCELEAYFFHCRTRRRRKDTRSTEEEWKFAAHCAGLYVRQGGRCTLTGHFMPLPMYMDGRWAAISPISELQLTRPSIDRIDNALPHIEGNVTITSLVANKGRSRLTIPEFQAMLADASGQTGASCGRRRNDQPPL